MRGLLLLASIALALPLVAQEPPRHEPQFPPMGDTLPKHPAPPPRDAFGDGPRLLAGAHWSRVTGPTAHVALLLSRNADHFGFSSGPFIGAEAGRDGMRIGVGAGTWHLAFPMGGLARLSY